MLRWIGNQILPQFDLLKIFVAQLKAEISTCSDLQPFTSEKTASLIKGFNYGLLECLIKLLDHLNPTQSCPMSIWLNGLLHCGGGVYAPTPVGLVILEGSSGPLGLRHFFNKQIKCHT